MTHTLELIRANTVITASINAHRHRTIVACPSWITLASSRLSASAVAVAIVCANRVGAILSSPSGEAPAAAWGNTDAATRAFPGTNRLITVNTFPTHLTNTFSRLFTTTMLETKAAANGATAIHTSPPFIAVTLAVFDVQVAVEAVDSLADFLITKLTRVAVVALTHTRHGTIPPWNVATSGTYRSHAINTCPALEAIAVRMGNAQDRLSVQLALAVDCRNDRSIWRHSSV